jgi:antitoxin component YwqK of YwqJK toxin-antitoxin module
LHGTSRFYTKGNNITAAVDYNKGKCSGHSNSYYLNGKPKVLAFCKNGKLEGTAKEFDKKGELTSLISYKNGEEINRVTF